MEPIYQYTHLGTFVAKYKSVSSASKATGTPVTSIRKNASGEILQAGGYLWCELMDPTRIALMKLELKRYTKDKEVFQFTLQGIFIAKHVNAAEAKRAVMVADASNKVSPQAISVAAIRMRHAGGFLWSKFKDPYVALKLVTRFRTHSQDSKLGKSVIRKAINKLDNNEMYDIVKPKVYQYTLKGELVEAHVNIKEAYKTLGTSESVLNAILEGDRYEGLGYLFTYDDSEDHVRSMVSSIRSKVRDAVIYQYSKNGTFIRSWVNLSTASKGMGINYNGIRGCLIGNIKSSGGYMWCYSATAKSVKEIHEAIRPK